MGKEKLFSEELLCAALLVGVVFGVVAGVAIYASAYPVFQSSNWAAWVQAIGSIVAIYFAARIGRKQAETAFHIHSLDIQQRAKERQEEIDRQDRADTARAVEEKENALAETAVHRISMRRINLQIISLYGGIDLAARDIARERQALLKLEEKRERLLSSSDFTELKNVNTDIDITNGYLSRAESSLAGYAPSLEEAIEKLSKLPRSVIRVASGKLADRVTSAINNLQNAVLEMEHVKDGPKITRSISAADRDLLEYCRELDLLLEGRRPE